MGKSHSVTCCFFSERVTSSHSFTRKYKSRFPGNGKRLFAFDPMTGSSDQFSFGFCGIGIDFVKGTIFFLISPFDEALKCLEIS